MAERNLRRAAVAVGALAGSAALVAALIVLRSHEETREELPGGRTSLERQEAEVPASMAPVETRIAPATRRRTFTLTVRWPGGAPAAGLDAEIMPLDAAQPFQRLRHVETDAAGRIVLEDPPERLELRIPREWARVEAEEHQWPVATRIGHRIETLGETERTITLPGGADVTFRAMDASGAAIAGARLFVGNRLIGDPSAPLGCTGPDGALAAGWGGGLRYPWSLDVGAGGGRALDGRAGRAAARPARCRGGRDRVGRGGSAGGSRAGAPVVWPCAGGERRPLHLHGYGPRAGRALPADRAL